MAEVKYQWGKMSRGQPYVILATDVLIALFSLGLGEIEGKIVAHVIENTWGLTAKRGRKGEAWSDTVPCSLDLKQLEAALEYQKTHICSAISRLVKSNILLKVEGGYLFNKEADKWIKPDGERRLSDESLALAASRQRLKPSIESNIIVTTNRNESTTAITLDRNEQAFEITVDRNVSTTGVTVERNAQNKERTRGNSTRSNTNPTGFNANSTAPRTGDNSPTPRARPDVPKQRGLALEEDLEPFMSPVDAYPLPMPPSEPDDPETARLIAELHPLIIDATRTSLTPEGNGETSDFLEKRIRDWRRLNHSATTIAKFVRKAIDKIRPFEAMPGEKYVAKCLNSEAANRETATAPLKPSQTKPMKFYTGMNPPGAKP